MLSLLVLSSAAFVPSCPMGRAPLPAHAMGTRAALVASLVEMDQGTAQSELKECLVDAETTGEAMECIDSAASEMGLDATNKPISLDDRFSLQDQDDGWDDVREAIRFAKKDRAKAWKQLGEYVGPRVKTASDTAATASRWAKVLADEVDVPALPAVPNLDLSSPLDGIGNGIKAASSSANLKDKAFAFGGVLLDAAVAKKEAERKKDRAIVEAKAEKEREQKSVSTAGAANVALLLGVPVITLAGIAALTLGM